MVGGGVGIVVAVITGALAASKARELEKPMTVFDPNVEKAGKNLNAVAVVSGLLGVAAGVTGAILYFTDKPGTEHANASGTTSLALAPFAGPGLGGFSARLAF